MKCVILQVLTGENFYPESGTQPTKGPLCSLLKRVLGVLGALDKSTKGEFVNL